MNRHDLPFPRHAATDMSAVGWVMIANSSNCLISPVWLASMVDGDSIINATLLDYIILQMVRLLVYIYNSGKSRIYV